ncbi:nitroreductase [Mesorhizobium soli]|nr:nitroreductase [Mesorhizobium soli]
MDVYEAVTSRRSVRGFKDEPVSREVLERVLSAAAWSPSGSNIQPWNTYVLTGAALAELKTRAVERVCRDERQYEMYPPVLKSPYGERRSAFGKERYSALGITREDWEARQRAAIGNWNCFGAPAALFCYIDRDPGPAPMGRRRHVSADNHAAAPRRRAAQLPADGVVAGSRDCRGGPVALGPAHPLLRHVDRVRGPHGELRPYGPRPAPGDGHVRRRLAATR